MRDQEVHAAHLMPVGEPLHLRVGELLAVGAEDLAHGDVVVLAVGVGDRAGDLRHLVEARLALAPDRAGGRRGRCRPCRCTSAAASGFRRDMVAVKRTLSCSMKWPMETTPCSLHQRAMPPYIVRPQASARHRVAVERGGLLVAGELELVADQQLGQVQFALRDELGHSLPQSPWVSGSS